MTDHKNCSDVNTGLSKITLKKVILWMIKPYDRSWKLCADAINACVKVWHRLSPIFLHSTQASHVHGHIQLLDIEYLPQVF